MRAQYISAEDILNEDAIGEFIKQELDCPLTKLNTEEPPYWDFYSESLDCYFEAKCRNYTKESIEKSKIYPGFYMISTKKINNGIETGKSFSLYVKFDSDGLHRYDYDKEHFPDRDGKIFKAMGGRIPPRDKYDWEMCHWIPLNLFRKVA